MNDSNRTNDGPHSSPQSAAGTPEAAASMELTWPAIILGILLSLIMGAANVYLGLRAGMTVSASIPAAVISMGILRGILGRRSVLESNLVQTSASAGESLAAGIIFTMPALILTGVWQDFDFWTTSLIALTGGLLGILMMIPMRKVFVVENSDLKFPEGLACAAVLQAGDSNEQEGSSGLGLIIGGLGIGALFKLFEKLVGLIQSTAEVAMVRAGHVFYIGTEVSPALFAVGYIVTLPIALEIFAGGVIGWLLTIPMLGTEGLTQTAPLDMAYELWSTKVRYLGVGAMVVGGVASIWTVRNGLRAAAQHLLTLMKNRHEQDEEVATERNLNGGLIALLGVICTLLIAGLYYSLLDNDVALTGLTTIIMLVMSFFFAAVASYIVGLVGNSNSPVSGMTITAVLGTGALVMLFGFGGTSGIVATLGVAGVVCCVACTSGDVCNDLKTGHIVGASPRNQQVMQILGVVVAAFVMAPVMTILHEGSLSADPVNGGIGSKDLPAPQAGLFASLTDGFFGEGTLPKNMVVVGMVVGLLILIIDEFLRRSESKVRLHLMPVAVGIYLPFGLSVPIVLGGIIRTLVDRRNPPDSETATHRGILMTSGLIAGESLVGVLLGLFAWLGIQSWGLSGKIGSALGLSETGQSAFAQCLSVAALLAVALWVLFVARRTLSAGKC